MNYWITTHWPPYKGKNHKNVAKEIWVPDGREEAGKDLRAGDLILVYQSRSGRTIKITEANGAVKNLTSTQGKEGIIAITEAVDSLCCNGNDTETEYTNGTKIWWRWHAPLKIVSKSGFVNREDINIILGYKPNYNLHGFGDCKSGLKKITKEEFDSLRKKFNSYSPIKKTDNNSKSKLNRFSKYGEGGESKEHKNLKKYIASNPEQILQKKGLTTVEVEYSFPTGDSADIVLKDSFNRIIGVEIEIDIYNKQIEGLLQAIKYRYMLEVAAKRKKGDSRAFLIAYSISKQIKNLCKKYDVEFFEIKKIIVQKWLNER